MPQKYLRTRVIGSVEAVEVLMSFHQTQMTREVIYLPTDVKPTRRMLKSKRDLVQLEEGSSDIYMSTRFDEYLASFPDLPARTQTYAKYFICTKKREGLGTRLRVPTSSTTTEGYDLPRLFEMVA